MYQQIAGAEGNGERLNRHVGSLHRKRGTHRHRPSRGQTAQSTRDAVDQHGQSRPWPLDLTLDTTHPDHAGGSLLRTDLGGHVEDGRLSDARLADDRERATMAISGASHETHDSVDDVTATPKPQ